MKKIRLLLLASIGIIILAVIALFVFLLGGEGSRPPKYRSDAPTITIETFTSDEAHKAIPIDYTFCRFYASEADESKNEYIYVDNGDDDGTEAVMKIFGEIVVFKLLHNDDGTITGTSEKYSLEVTKGKKISEISQGFSIYKGSIKLTSGYHKDLIHDFYGVCGSSGLN